MRRGEELDQLLTYVALGFDHKMVAKNRATVKSPMQDLQTLEHLSQYGRPLYVTLVRQRQLLTLEPGGARSYLKGFVRART